MKAAVLNNPGDFVWNEVEEPLATPTDALVKVLRCGVCGTDTHALAGRQPFFSYPRRLGHELCVQVIDAPPDARVRRGDVCAVEPYLFCGRCSACLAGRTNCCRELKVLGVHVDGGHAPRIAVPADKLHPSSRLSADELAMVEPLAIGAHGIQRTGVAVGESVLVVGLGPIGLAALLSAKAAGARCIGVDVQQHRVQFAGRIGLPALVATGEWKSAIETYFSERPRVVVDATGNPASMQASFDLPDNGGRLAFLGLFIGSVTFDDPSFHRRELTLLASRAALPQTFSDVVRMIEEKRIDARALITHRVAFADLVDRLPTLAREASLVKAIIDVAEAS